MFVRYPNQDMEIFPHWLMKLERRTCISHNNTYRYSSSLYAPMLGVVENLFSYGGFLHVGEVLSDVLSSTYHAISHFLDLPVDMSSLESSLRFVKKSGFETDTATPVVASVGLKIGGARIRNRTGSRLNSSASSTSALNEGGATTPDPDDYPKSSGSSSATGFASVVPKAMLVFLVMDLLSIVFARQSALNPCVSKLGIVQWVIGGACLGFPATWIVDGVRREYSFRSAFIVELLLIVVSFVWLCFGGATVFNVVSTCVDSIAPLWWLSYASSVLSLSIAGTVIFCMIVTTVLSLIYGSSQGK